MLYYKQKGSMAEEGIKETCEMCGKRKIFVMLNMNMEKDYNIVDLIKIICRKNLISKNDTEYILNNVILRPANNTELSDEDMNILYNACDVGVNSCLGEGFGICNFEHACFGKPQIFSNVGGLKDIFEEHKNFCYPVNPVASIYIASNIDTRNGYGNVTDPKDFCKGISFYYNNRETMLTHGKILKEKLINEYKWDIQLKLFYKNIFAEI